MTRWPRGVTGELYYGKTTYRYEPTYSPDEVTNEDFKGQVVDALSERSAWETRASNWYKMRHTGMGRKKKPFPTAAEMHCKLIDTEIEKLKPIYLQQIIGMDVLCSFIPMQPQAGWATTGAEQWFDYKIREKSNFVREAFSWIDFMLVYGRAVMKVYWDADKKAVCYNAIDPLYFITNAWANDIQEADWCVHVQHYTEESLKREKRFRKLTGEELKRAKGAKGSDTAGNTRDQEKYNREGITDSSEDFIVVWECYRRLESGKIEVRTFLPSAPEIKLEDAKEMPYDHGEFPFVDAPYELKDKGWYSPRGLAEILAPLEIGWDSVWNHKQDALAFYNRPLFQSERDIATPQNYVTEPGAFLPHGVKPVQWAPPPVNWDQEITQFRMLGEMRTGNPDYAMGQVINTANRRTAREIESINAQSQQGYDMRIRLYRMALGSAYKQAWSLLVQYDNQDLRYRYLDEAMQADPGAIQANYTLEPKGGMDLMSKQQLLQQSIQMKQVFVQSPWIDQSQLDRCIINLWQPNMVKLLFRDPQLKQQDEAADEQRNIPALLTTPNIPIPVRQGDNFGVRVQVLMTFLQNVQQSGNDLPPEPAQAIIGRLQSLLGAWEQVDTNNARAAKAQVAQFFKQASAPPPQVKVMPKPAQPQPQGAMA